MQTRNNAKDQRRRPGEVRDAIVAVLSTKLRGAPVSEIEEGVGALIGEAALVQYPLIFLFLDAASIFRRGRSRALHIARSSCSAENRADGQPRSALKLIFIRSRTTIGDRLCQLAPATA